MCFFLLRFSFEGATSSAGAIAIADEEVRRKKKLTLTPDEALDRLLAQHERKQAKKKTRHIYDLKMTIEGFIMWILLICFIFLQNGQFVKVEH